MGSLCKCKPEFHTVGEYQITNPQNNFGCSNPQNVTISTGWNLRSGDQALIFMPSSCPSDLRPEKNVKALLKMEVQFQTATPTLEYFNIIKVRAECDSNFLIAPGTVSDDGAMITCPVPRVQSDDGVEGFFLQVSLNGLDWEEPIDFPHFQEPSVKSIEPKFGYSTGGTLITVNGSNFVNDPPTYCFLVNVRTDETTLVVAEFVGAKQVICKAPPLKKRDLALMKPFIPLQFAVYFSLNGRERGSSLVNGTSQETSYNYYSLPKVERVTPDSGFDSDNQTLSMYTTDTCLDLSANSQTCKPVMVRVTSPPYCTKNMTACKEYTRRVTLERSLTSYAQVQPNLPIVQIGQFKFQAGVQAYVLGLEFSVEGNPEILHAQNFTLYNNLIPPSGCRWVGVDSEPQKLRCVCIIRTLAGIYQLTDPDRSDESAQMTSVPTRRFDLCNRAPLLTKATPVITPASGGATIRLAARSFPNWMEWYDVSQKTYHRFGCIYKFEVYRDGWQTEYRVTNATMRSKIAADFTWYSVYLLYWYKSANTDAERAAGYRCRQLLSALDPLRIQPPARRSPRLNPNAAGLKAPTPPTGQTLKTRIAAFSVRFRRMEETRSRS